MKEIKENKWIFIGREETTEMYQYECPFCGNTSRLLIGKCPEIHMACCPKCGAVISEKWRDYHRIRNNKKVTQV